MSEDAIKSKSKMKSKKLNQIDALKMNSKSIQHLDTKLRTNGYVYEYYGTSVNISDSTGLIEFMNEGGIIVRTSEINNPEGVYATMVNFDKISSNLIKVKGIVAYLRNQIESLQHKWNYILVMEE